MVSRYRACYLYRHTPEDPVPTTAVMPLYHVQPCKTPEPIEHFLVSWYCEVSVDAWGLPENTTTYLVVSQQIHKGPY